MGSLKVIKISSNLNLSNLDKRVLYFQLYRNETTIISFKIPDHGTVILSIYYNAT